MADGVFQRTYSLRSSDFDKFSQIKPSAVLDLFQTVAGLHAESLGVGFEAMQEKGLLWVILKVKYELIAMPQSYDNVTVRTWPKEPKRLDFQRNYEILDEKGEIIIKGASQWAVIDKNTRKLARVTDVYKNIDAFYEKDVFEEKLIRVPDFDESTPEITVSSSFCEFDTNNHVNNIRYADYVMNAINPQKPLNIKKLQLDFHKEIVGEDTEIFIEEKDKILAKGVQNKALMFSCSIERD